MLHTDSPSTDPVLPAAPPPGYDLALSALPAERPEAKESFTALTKNLSANLRTLSVGIELTPSEREILEVVPPFLAAAWTVAPQSPERITSALVKAWERETVEKPISDLLPKLLRAGLHPDTESRENGTDGILGDIVRDAVVALDAKKETEDLFLRRPAPSPEAAPNWFAREIGRLRGLRFRTLPGTLRFGKRLEKNIEELEDARDRLAHDGFTSQNQKTTLSLYRSMSRNMIDMITLADQKAGLLLNANAISLSVLLSFFGKDILSDRTLWLPSMLVAGTCAMTVIFASLAAAPIRRTSRRVSLEEFTREGLSFLHYGDVARLSRADFLRGFHSAAREGQHLEENMLSELHFFANRITTKFRRVRYAYVTMIGGIILAAVAFAVTQLGR